MMTLLFARIRVGRGLRRRAFAPRFLGIEAVGNFRVETFPPWLSFEAQDDPLGLRAPDGFQPSGIGLTPLAYGTTSGNGSEAVGLSNWKPPGTPTVRQSELRPWWLFGNEPDPNTPWLNVRAPDGSPGFRVAPDGSVASGSTGNRTALGLDPQVPAVGQASPVVGGPFAQHAWPMTDQPVDTQTGWSRFLGQSEGRGFEVAPNGSIAPGQTGNGGALGLDRQAANVGPLTPFVGGPFAQQTWPLMEPSPETSPWWTRQPGQGEGLEGRSDLRWPWLRAEPTDEPSGSGLNPDGSGDQSKPDGFNLLSFAYQPFDQMPPENFVADGTAQP
jgi:hypothetical protein